MILNKKLHKSLLEFPIIKVKAPNTLFGFDWVSADVLSTEWVEFNVNNTHNEQIELLISVDHSPSILGKEAGSDMYSYNANISSSFQETLRLINTFTFMSNKYDIALNVALKMLTNYLALVDESKNLGILKTLSIHEKDDGFLICSIVDGKNYFLNERGLKTSELKFPNEVKNSSSDFEYSLSGPINKHPLQYFTFSNKRTGQAMCGVMNSGAEILKLRQGDHIIPYYGLHYKSDFYTLMQKIIHQTGLFFRSHSITATIKKEKICFDLTFLASFFGQLIQLNGEPIQIGNTELTSTEVLKIMNIDFYDLASKSFDSDSFDSLDLKDLGLYGFIVFCIVESYASNKLSHEHNDPEKYIQMFIEKNYTFII